jgi:broad specificity phosphatase PhoE
MPILLLIRHGTNDYVKTGRLPGQAPNIHLNDEGRSQALALAKLLEKQPICAVYASQLEPAIDTAWPIAAPRGLPIVIRPGLADTNVGDYTSRVIKELSESPETKDNWKTIVEKPSEGQLPNGESLLEMQARVVAALERICAEHPDPEPPKSQEPQPEPAATGEVALPPAKPPAEPERKPPVMIAVVMPNDPIKAAVAHYLGMPFDNFQRIGASPASVSTVMVMKEHVMLVNLNQIPYS